ncbi:MAG: HD domain-containing protein [Oscillospiraceae bacterium]|nr:HD domain-containing protein [Oscillospiraceae bacterium]
MPYVPDLRQAREILAKYNKEPFHISHGEIVSGVMGYFARKHDPDREAYWRIAGMLHDIDFELYPEEHCVKGEELMRGEDIDESVIRSALSHGYKMTGTPYEPECIMERILYAADELTGLIGAAALMRPSKSVSDMEYPSVIKKFKDKKFAAGCSRDVIRAGAEMLGWTLEELITETILAMRELEAVS